MPKFLTFHSPSPRELKENPLKALFESFQSLDRFTKGFLIVIFLFLLATPFIVNNLQIFKPHAQETEPTLGEQTPPAPPSVPDEILIKFKAGVDEKAKDNIRSAHGLTKKDEITQIGVERAKVPEKAKDKIIEALKHNPRVEYAEPNYLNKAQLIPNDTYFITKQWNLTKISAPAGWDISTGSPSAVIAILDTGVDLNHEDLIGKASGTQDDNGHGTQVAGLAGAATNNGKGIAGVCWLCPLLSVKVLNSTGSGSDDSAAEGITYAADHAAKVINLSLGSYSFSQTMQNAVNYAWSKGVVIVGASGNDGLTSPMYPAAMDNVISVGATGTSDTRSSISNYGPWLDVVAPGVSVTTTRMGNLYGAVGGTSMAAPHVAALAGLIFSANPNLTNQQVVDIITSTADDLGATGKDDYYGYGRINAAKALQKAINTTPEPTPTPTPTPTPSPIPPPLDTTNPTTNVTSPTDGSTISGNTNISASASDNVGLSTISIFVDGSVVNVCNVSGTSSSCSYSLDTTQYPNGSHTIQSKALDSSSNLGQSTTITVNVNNVTSTPTPSPSPTPSPTLSPTPTPTPIPSDTTPPTVSITNPLNGSNVKANSQLNITANVTDNIKVSKVEFYVAGSLKCSSTLSSGPYSCSTWKVPAKKGVNYTITVKGYDTSNNTNSAYITVKAQ